MNSRAAQTGQYWSDKVGLGKTNCAVDLYHSGSTNIPLQTPWWYQQTPSDREINGSATTACVIPLLIQQFQRYSRVWGASELSSKMKGRAVSEQGTVQGQAPGMEKVLMNALNKQVIRKRKVSCSLFPWNPALCKALSSFSHCMQGWDQNSCRSARVKATDSGS